MKFLKFLTLIILFVSCSKDKNGSTTILLTKYQWYASAMNVTNYTVTKDTVLSTVVYPSDSCVKNAYYIFKADKTVTREMPCISDKATGSWNLAADSTFYVSIPYGTLNVGFISVNGPLKLVSIDNSEMKTNYTTQIAFYSNGVMSYGWQSSTMIYKHR